ncbi:MAG: hypothetical protein ACOYOK_10190, partial [Pseudobdellovibrionaceae bacterium]
IFSAFLFFPFAKAQDHGGGKESAPAAQEAKASTKQEWVDLQIKVQTLETKIKMGEENFKKLVEEKNHTKDHTKTHEIVSEMKSQYKELEKMTQEYETHRSALIYRYPERAAKSDRIYEKKQLRPISEMENQFTIEGRIKTVLKKVQKKYGYTDSKSKQGSGRNPSSVDGESYSDTVRKSSSPDSSESSLTDAVLISK